jgi:SAM-dependent methyltransferase
VRQTRASFDYQWASLPQGSWSLANEEFRRRVPALLCELTLLDAEWFRGRDALDAGCGSGRHAFGLCALGANVVALDQSRAALELTRRNCAPFPNFRGAFEADLLDPLPAEASFDLVWSYGVLHSTGDTRRALENVAAAVRAGGYLALMLYGEPRPGNLEDHGRVAFEEGWRDRCRTLSFPETVAAVETGMPEKEPLVAFDLVSPAINDRCTEAELRAWLDAFGFVDVTRTVDSLDHYVVARKA